MQIKSFGEKVNPSAPQPEGWGLFRVDPERRFSTSASKAKSWRHRMGQYAEIRRLYPVGNNPLRQRLRGEWTAGFRVATTGISSGA